MMLKNLNIHDYTRGRLYYSLLGNLEEDCAQLEKQKIDSSLVHWYDQK